MHCESESQSKVFSFYRVGALKPGMRTPITTSPPRPLLFDHSKWKFIKQFRRLKYSLSKIQGGGKRNDLEYWLANDLHDSSYRYSHIPIYFVSFSLLLHCSYQYQKKLWSHDSKYIPTSKGLSILDCTMIEKGSAPGRHVLLTLVPSISCQEREGEWRMYCTSEGFAVAPLVIIIS